MNLCAHDVYTSFLKPGRFVKIRRFLKQFFINLYYLWFLLLEGLSFKENIKKKKRKKGKITLNKKDVYTSYTHKLLCPKHTHLFEMMCSKRV